MTNQQIAREVLSIEADALMACANRLGEELSLAVDMIDKTQGKVVIIGVGKSGLVGAKIAATFASTGTASFFIHPTEAMHGDLGMIGKGDLVIAISYSGESDELISILPHIKRFSIPLIGMSSNPMSSLGTYSDVHLSIAIEKEACPLGAAPTTSTTLTMALGDVLAVCLMKKRNFKKEDFASFHPGGSLGRRLFVKALDLARTTNLPIIDESTPLKDAILTISEGRLGNALIVKDQKLIAVLSDGDIRRALMTETFSLDTPAITYATKNPKKCTNLSILASDALALIEESKVQVLVFTDEEGTLKGVLHLHDLVEAGIK